MSSLDPPPQISKQISQYLQGALVIFPGETPVQRNPSIIQPLSVTSGVKLNSTPLEINKHYLVIGRADFYVPDDEKLVILVVDGF
jgi:hypothetical protein